MTFKRIDLLLIVVPVMESGGINDVQTRQLHSSLTYSSSLVDCLGSIQTASIPSGSEMHSRAHISTIAKVGV